MRRGLRPHTPTAPRCPPCYARTVALYVLQAKVFKRSFGASAVAAAAYRAGEKLFDDRGEEEHDFERRQGVEFTEIMTPDPAPEWALDRSQLWNQAEAAERRKDAQVAREVMVALPVELNEPQRRELVRGFVHENFTSQGMVADIAHHSGEKPGGEPNPHAHIMLTLRRFDGDRFAASKERAWNEHDLSQSWRKSWADRTNRALERGGHRVQVDHRTLKAQRADALKVGDHEAAAKLDREPQVHLGKAYHMELQGFTTARGIQAIEIAKRNGARAEERSRRDYQREVQRQGFGEQERSQKAERARAALGVAERLVPVSEEERAVGQTVGQAVGKRRAQAKRRSGEEQAAPPKRRWWPWRGKSSAKEAGGDKAAKSFRSSVQAYAKEVATRYADQIEKGKASLQKGYDKPRGSDHQPFNPATLKRYKGLNAIQLKSVAQEKGYDDPRWMSAAAAKRGGVKIRKGERGTRVEYLRFPPKSQASQGKDSPEASSGEKGKEQPRISHHTYVVFNAEQIERMPALEQQLAAEPQSHEVCKRADRIIRDSGVQLESPPQGQNYSTYDRDRDTVVIPPRDRFKSYEAHYSQAVKEITGRAGHELRKDHPEPQGEAQQAAAEARHDMRREMAHDTICSKLHLPKKPTGERHQKQWAETIRNNPSELRHAARDADRMADKVLEHDRPLERSQAEPSRVSSVAEVTPEMVRATKRALQKQQQWEHEIGPSR